MRKTMFTVVLALLCGMANAQECRRVVEPEFINSYCILTSDSTYAKLPKESGMISKHQTKLGKFARIAGGASQTVFGAGMVGAYASGSAGGFVNGIRVAGGALGAGQIADAAGSLASASGMDIVFKGGHSAYVVPKEMEEIWLVIRAENNEYAPMDIYRIVKFIGSRKERRIQWMDLHRHC